MAKTFSIPESVGEDFTNIIASAKENIGNDAYHPIGINKIVIEDNPRKLKLSIRDIIEGLKEDDQNYQTKKEEIESLAEITESIKRHDVLNPIQVYKKDSLFYLIMGQRRTLASLLANKKTIYAKVWETKPSDLEIKTSQWVENFHRKNLSTWEAFCNVDNLASMYFEQNNKNISVTELATCLSCSKAQSVKYHALLHAADDIKEAMKTGRLNSLAKAYEITKVDNGKERESIIQKVADGEITQDALLAQSKQNRQKTIKPNKTPARGRKRTNISLGTSLKPALVKEIVDALLSKKKYQKVRTKMGDIDWENYSDISKKFTVIIKELEKIQ